MAISNFSTDDSFCLLFETMEARVTMADSIIKVPTPKAILKKIEEALNSRISPIFLHFRERPPPQTNLVPDRKRCAN